MYTRNGALVIISRAKELKDFLKKQFYSLRVQVFLILSLFVIIPAWYLSVYTNQVSLQEQIQIQADDQQYQCNALSKQLSKMKYFEDLDNVSANAKIDLLADVFNGRILIIDDAFQIVKDTYGLDKDKYHIGQEVISCYGGTNSYNYCKDESYIEFTLPVYDFTMEEISGVMLVTTSVKGIAESVQRQHDKLQVVEIISCILLMALAVIFSWLLIKPFRDLIQEINRTSFNMEPVTIPKNHETAQIAKTYNEILIRLKHLDESRQEFVSNVSHELKTPITSIRVLADTLINMGEAPVEMYQEFMGDISQEIDRESVIIEDLLTMVRLEQTGAELEVAPVNINELLERVLKRLRPIAAKREIEIYLESFRPVVAEADEVKLTRAFTNLVENAVKYNNDGGWVRVSLNADHNYFYVKIVDNGVGIPEDAVDKIFERFYRVDKARSRETGGTGLGLSITRTIIRLHHGVVKVHSELGNGTTFHIRIPLNYMG